MWKIIFCNIDVAWNLNFSAQSNSKKKKTKKKPAYNLT